METRETITAELERSLGRWKELYEVGGADPFWSDGVNLNLVRNHIRWYLKKLEELEQAGVQMSLFAAPSAVDWSVVPPLVDQDYMAQPDKIRSDAKATMEVLENSDLVRELIAYEQGIPETGHNRTYRMVTTHQVEGLKRAIEKDNLVEMRRYRDADYELMCLEQRKKRYQESPLTAQEFDEEEDETDEDE